MAYRFLPSPSLPAHCSVNLRAYCQEHLVRCIESTLTEDIAMTTMMIAASGWHCIQPTTYVSEQHPPPDPSLQNKLFDPVVYNILRKLRDTKATLACETSVSAGEGDQLQTGSSEAAIPRALVIARAEKIVYTRFPAIAKRMSYKPYQPLKPRNWSDELDKTNLLADEVPELRPSNPRKRKVLHEVQLADLKHVTRYLPEQRRVDEELQNTKRRREDHTRKDLGAGAIEPLNDKLSSKAVLSKRESGRPSTRKASPHQGAKTRKTPRDSVRKPLQPLKLTQQTADRVCRRFHTRTGKWISASQTTPLAASRSVEQPKATSEPLQLPGTQVKNSSRRSESIHPAQEPSELELNLGAVLDERRKPSSIKIIPEESSSSDEIINNQHRPSEGRKMAISGTVRPPISSSRTVAAALGTQVEPTPENVSVTNGVEGDFSDDDSIFYEVLLTGKHVSPPQITAISAKTPAQQSMSRITPSHEMPDEIILQTNVTQPVSPAAPPSSIRAISKTSHLSTPKPIKQGFPSARTPDSPAVLTPTVRKTPSVSKLLSSDYLANLSGAKRIITCFRIAEAIRLRQQVQSTPVPVDQDRHVYTSALSIELYACVHSLSRNGLKSVVEFQDLFFPGRPPYIKAVCNSWRSFEKKKVWGLLQAVSKGEIDVMDQKRWCRAILRNQIGDDGKVVPEMEMMDLVEVEEGEVALVRGIVDGK